MDLKIVGGEIVDGTGSAGYFGTVLVEGDTLRLHRGDPSGIPAARTVDATGHVVCPGFIDVHSHGGLTIMREPHHLPKVRQGVTTELIGIDGNSFAPFKSPADLHRFIELDCGLNDWPPMPADWLTVAELLRKYDGRASVNVAYILGNSPVRIWGVGWDDRPATAAEVADMRAVVREAMEEGAWGLSTGLDYPPGSFASTAELIELSQEAARLGGFYHTHTRASLRAQGLLAPWEEALEIGRRSGIAVHLTHYRQSAQGTGSHLDYLGLVEQARDSGLDVTFDCYTYPYSGTRVTILLPPWTMDGGPERLKQALRDPAARTAMAREMSQRDPGGTGLHECWLTNFRLPQHKPYEGHSIAEIGAMRAQDPLEALFDLLAAEGLGISMVGLGTNPHTLPAFVSHPYGMIGSDALLFGDYPNPRSYGCFPLVLAEYVRAERHLRLPEAIRKMTSFPAQRIGLPDRGLLRDGFKADLVIFDKERVKTRATKAQPKVFPEGIPYVIVNGQVVIDQGQHTGLFPGRALRRA
ncbi:MAG TPA: D-aminoacylase [Chloroflexota bacterium]|nr:D-aminoacylase [Chloroflexota bacterium]